VSSGQHNTKLDRAELEAAIDALLAEIDTTCTRFENPQAAEEDEDLAEYTKAMAATVTALPAPPHAPDLQATAGDTDGSSAAGAEAERAIDGAEAAAENLLEAAADKLIESLEAEVADAGHGTQPDATDDAEPEPDQATNDDLLGEALDGLLDHADGVADAPSDESDAAEPEPLPEPEPEPDRGAMSKPVAEPVADLKGGFDELLDGSFESADGETVDTGGVNTLPDPTLLLDPTGSGKPEPTPKVQNPAPVIPPTPVVGPEQAATVPKPAPVAAAVASVPEPPVVKPPSPASPPKVKHRQRAAGGLGGNLIAALEPVVAKVLVLMSKPLEGKPHSVRDSIGWVAIWTLFLGLCVWSYAMLRPAPVPVNDGRGTQVVTAETPAE
jgi:hypothetical protein